MTAPAPNQLVAPADDKVKPWDGAGALSSVTDLNDAVASDHADPFELVFSGAAAALDLLDAAMHPLDALLQAGVGWLIEHVSFLHEALDALAGDPTQITAQARTWHNVAAELRSVAAEHRRNAALPGWEGDAAQAYRRHVGTFAGMLDVTAGYSEGLSGLVLTTGAGVGTERALIRDGIAEFLALVIEYALAYLALALVTAGGSLGLLVETVVVKAIELGTSIARRVSQLLDALHAAGGTAAQLSEAIRDTAAQVRAAAPVLRTQVDEFAERAGDVVPGEGIEAGKQITGAAQDSRDWDAPKP